MAAKLMAFVDAWYEGEKYRRSRVEQQSYDILTRSLHEQVAACIIAKQAAEAKHLTLERAIDDALSSSV